MAAVRKIAAAFRQASRELNIPVEWGGDWKTLKTDRIFSYHTEPIRHEALAHAWRRFPSDCRMGNIHASVVVAGPGERQKRAQASTLKSTADTLNIISAGVQDMQQVLAQLRVENQQRNQDGRGKT